MTAADPRLLVCLKSYRNAIPIPQHWSAKRDYLAGKRGIEKPPFQLPSYIADTGIGIQREAVKEKEDGQSLKQKTRERVQPKMGKIDIDYQKLHDAFFKYQVPGKMTLFGEMYYEGKEFETDLRNKRPGELSKELIEALSIPPLAPPPWLIAMQRFGPPPSYPQLKIQGLNCPIPEGAQWGFHPGGWGKPPVDEYMRPLYGDVFGVNTNQNAAYNGETGEPIETETWGELEPDEESDEEEEEEEEDEEMEEAPPGDGMQTPAGGMVTPSGMASTASTVPGGLETPDFMDLRKKREGTDSIAPASDEKRDLYTVVQERRGAPGSAGFLGSDRTYDLSGMANTAAPIGTLGQEDRGSKVRLMTLTRCCLADVEVQRKSTSGVEIALDPAELEGMTEQELRQRYDAQRNRAAQSGGGAAGQSGREDFSDFVADEVAKRRERAREYSLLLAWTLLICFCRTETRRLEQQEQQGQGEVQVLGCYCRMYIVRFSIDLSIHSPASTPSTD